MNWVGSFPSIPEEVGLALHRIDVIVVLEDQFLDRLIAHMHPCERPSQPADRLGREHADVGGLERLLQGILQGWLGRWDRCGASFLYPRCFWEMARLDGAHPFRFCGVGGHADRARDHPLQMVDGRHDHDGAHRFEIRQSVEHQLSRPIVVERRSVHIPERLPLWIEFKVERSICGTRRSNSRSVRSTSASFTSPERRRSV